MNIVGAGMAGLLAANMLKHRTPTVYEVQSALPNNHSAVLRFRSPEIGDIVRLPFRKVTMIKCTQHWRNPVADALAYSFKNTSQYRSDRSVTVGTVEDDRYIAPPNLIAHLAAYVNVNYNTPYEFKRPEGWEPSISTIPMPALMQTLKYPGRIPAFISTPGINFRARISGCDAYASVLVPDPELPFSRISLTGDEVIVECYGRQEEISEGKVWDAVTYTLGIPFYKFSDFTKSNQRYAKINPIDEDDRKAFVFWATDNYGIFSLGRFATWRPGLLLDHLVKDIRLIDRWIDRSDRYSIARHR